VTDVGEISVSISANAKALDAALAKIEAQARGVKPISIPVEADTRATEASLRAAEGKALAFAQARARLLAQGGDLAGAERVLAGALDKTTASTTRTIGAQTQLLRVQQQLEKAGSGSKGVAGALQELGGMAGKVDNLVGAVAGLGGAFAAVQVAGAALDFARQGASIEAARQSFDNLAKSAGTSGAVLLKSLNDAAAGTVAQTDIIKSSNTALLLLGSDVADKLPQLLAVAKASAATLGTDVGQVFDSLVTGISRGSTELIDNAGITVKAAEAYATYAAEIGKSADALSSSEKQQAILNAVLTSGQQIIAQTSGGGTSAAQAYQQMDAALANLTTTAQTAAASAFAPLAEGIANTANAVNSGISSLVSYGDQLEALNQRVIAAGGGYTDYLSRIESVNTQIRESYGVFGIFAQTIAPLSESAYNLQQSLVASGVATEQAAVQAQAYQAALNAIAETQNLASLTMGELSAGYTAVATAASDAIASNAGLAPGIQDIVAAFNDQSISATEAQAQIAALTAEQLNLAAAQAELMGFTVEAGAALTDEAAAAQAAAQAANDKALADLEQEAAAQAAAAAHVELEAAILAAAGSSGSAQSAAAAIANAFGIEESKVIALINAHRELASARKGGQGSAAFTGGPTGGRRAGGLVGDDDVVRGVSPKEAAEQAAAARERTAKREAAILAAQRDQILATGTAAEKAAVRQAQYNEAVRQYGAASAEAIRAETALMQAQEKSAKGPTGGGATGGGKGGTSPKVTAATKAAQNVAKAEDTYRKASEAAEDAYRDRALDAEEAYQERRLSIMEDFAQKRRDAEMSFADAQVSDRADFYTSLIGVDKAQRTAMIQEYEAAQAKAAEIASTQGADAGERYLALITDIIQKRADRAAAIQKALEDGDKKEAEFLQGVDALARADEERKLQRATEGGDNLAGQEQDALADAAATRDEALAKAAEQRQDAIASAAERAGDASVTAQQRLAQAAAASNIPLQEQLATMERIKQLGATGAALPATGAGAAQPAPPPAPATAPAGPPPGGGPLLVSDAAVGPGFASMAEQLRAIARGIERMGNRPPLGT
jgi:hypothetical protein